MSTRGAKQVMYIYNGNEADPDLEFDANGAVPEPPTGTVVRRRGKQWQVAGTRIQAGAAELAVTPILKINLTDRF